MSLTLRILNRSQLDNGAPIEYVVHQRGMTIGRAPTCDWALPDPNRVISSRHCEVQFRSGAYLLVDVSTNGTFLNGGGNRMAEARRVSPGDRFQVGDYIIEARISGAAHEAFVREEEDARTAQTAGQSFDWDHVPGVVVPPKPAAPSTDPFGGGDGWDLPGAPAETVSDWADERGSGHLAPDGDAMFRRLTDQHHVDWSAADWDVGNSYVDPFANDAAASAFPPVSPAGGIEPQPQAPPASPIVSPTPAADPFAPLPGAPTPPSVQQAFPAAPDARSLAPDGWPQQVPPPHPPAGAQNPTFPPAPPPAPSPTHAPVAPSPATSGPDLTYQNLIRTLGIDPAKLHDSPDETGARAGRMLRRLLAGLMVLLEARARAKDQMGATSTQLRFDGNNPLKFAPGVDQALEMTLNPPARGYMEAEQAIEDAFRDLQAHQIATLRAMQGALKATLDRFSPASIEARTDSKGLLGKILPGRREAALWKAYQKEFSGVAQGSAEAFLEIFAKEFRKAYDEASRGG